MSFEKDGFQDIIGIVKKTGDIINTINKKETENSNIFLNSSSTKSLVEYISSKYTPEQLQKELGSTDIINYINHTHKNSRENKVNKIIDITDIISHETKPQLNILKNTIKNNENIILAKNVIGMVSGEDNEGNQIKSLVDEFVGLSEEKDRIKFIQSHGIIITPKNENKEKQDDKLRSSNETENDLKLSNLNGKDDLNYLNKITKETTDYTNIVESVIENIEGGYYHPNMNIKRMGKSGETMMGIDRKHGGNLNTSEDGKKFRSLIDEEKQKSPELRKHNYKGGDKEKELRSLAGKIIKPHYDDLCNKYLSKESLDLINKDGRLLFNFIYCAWNGELRFKKFANEINTEVKSGIKDTEVLYKHIINFRKNGTGNSLIAQGGKKIEKLLNSETYV